MHLHWKRHLRELGDDYRSSTQHMNPGPNTILLTRRRWDAYMLPLFLAVAAIGVVRAIQSGQLRFTLLPVVVIPICLMLRLQTPRDGMPASTVRSTPGAIVMLWFAIAALSSMTILLVIDSYIFEHPFRTRLKLYHALLFAPPFIIMFVGAFFADRIQKQHKLENGVLQDTAQEEPSTNNPMNPSGGSGVS